MTTEERLSLLEQKVDYITKQMHHVANKLNTVLLKYQLAEKKTNLSTKQLEK